MKEAGTDRSVCATFIKFFSTHEKLIAAGGAAEFVCAAPTALDCLLYLTHASGFALLAFSMG
jgi:hypothetical protein